MRSKLIATLAVAVVALAGAAVAATVPDGNGVIHGCRKLESGALRVVPRSSGCRSSEKPLNWNQRGAAGPQGPIGPAGPAGPRGPQGPAGPALTSFDSLAGLACTNAGKTGSISIAYDASGVAKLTCTTASTGKAVLKINEFSVGIEGTLGDEFVEIANASTAVADLSGWKLVYRSAAGTRDVSLGTIADGTKLAAGGFFLFGGADYSGRHPADKTFSAGLASASGGIALRDADGKIVDSVGWGEATNAFVEGTAAEAPPVVPAPGKSDVRTPNGHDTDVNSADFTVSGAPSPGASN
jgi:hypothetical protein